MNHDALIRYLAKHQRPQDFAVTFDVLAEIAECTVADLKGAMAGGLRKAFTVDLRILLTAPTCLAFLRTRPFKRAPDGSLIVPAILQTTEAEDRAWKHDHPLSQAFGAREDAVDALECQ